MDNIIKSFKAFVVKMNEYGIPLPLLRINGVPTLTGTMAFISFNTALLGQIGKVSNLIGNVDLSQANYLFLSCAGMYLGRRMQTNGSTKSVEFTKEKEDDNN